MTRCDCCGHPPCLCVQEDFCHCGKCIIHCICERVYIEAKLVDENLGTGMYEVEVEAVGFPEGKQKITFRYDQVYRYFDLHTLIQKGPANDNS